MQHVSIDNYLEKTSASQLQEHHNADHEFNNNLNTLHEYMWDVWTHRKENTAKLNLVFIDMNTRTLKNYANFLYIKAKAAAFNSISLHYELLKFRCKVLDIIQARDETGSRAIGYRW